MAKYSQYMSYMQENADLFGVQAPYFTDKDKQGDYGYSQSWEKEMC